MQLCCGGKARFCLPDLVHLKFWEVRKEISQGRGKVLTSKASRPQQSHWNQRRGCKGLIRAISYWCTSFFPTYFISLNWVQTLNGTLMERIWAASHVCFLTFASTSKYCILTLLVATLCCGFFLSGEKLCSSLCRWMCVGDASLLCQFSCLAVLSMNIPTRRVFSMHVPALGFITWTHQECTFHLHSFSVKGAVMWWNKAELVECFCGGRK